MVAAGTRHVWVVRLTGPRRVEVHEPGRELRTAVPGEQLLAPGILGNPVPVEALYDWSVGRRVTLRNLLQREGYEDLDAVRAEALRAAILRVAEARGLATTVLVEAVASCVELDRLYRWLSRAATATDAREIVAVTS